MGWNYKYRPPGNLYRGVLEPQRGPTDQMFENRSDISRKSPNIIGLSLGYFCEKSQNITKNNNDVVRKSNNNTRKKGKKISEKYIEMLQK